MKKISASDVEQRKQPAARDREALLRIHDAAEDALRDPRLPEPLRTTLGAIWQLSIEGVALGDLLRQESATAEQQRLRRAWTERHRDTVQYLNGTTKKAVNAQGKARDAVLRELAELAETQQGFALASFNAFLEHRFPGKRVPKEIVERALEAARVPPRKRGRPKGSTRSHDENPEKTVKPLKATTKPASPEFTAFKALFSELGIGVDSPGALQKSLERARAER